MHFDFSKLDTVGHKRSSNCETDCSVSDVSLFEMSDLASRR